MAYDAAVERYAADHGLPENEKWFEALIQAGILKPFQTRIDPWGHPYYYRRGANTYDLRTLGPDGEYGTEDDQTKETDWRWTKCSPALPAWRRCG
jgi:hypothetical protein